MSKVSYKSAGVNIEAGNKAVKRIKAHVEQTFSPQVLTSIGSFGSMYDLKSLLQNYHHPVLVQSIDGVGTKMIVARMMQKFDTIGIDLVSATTNDIVVLGAKPLTLLDYIAADRIQPETIEQIISGMAQACSENSISLVGGETAEMPGTYLRGEYDLVGIISGVVEKDKAITGKTIVAGDVLLAFPSSGLHTNGYSLARKLCFEIGGYQVESYIDDLGQVLGEVLLEPHINYARPVLHLLDAGISVKGMAHITGGGLLENIPRILPVGCSAEIIKARCPQLPLFDFLTHLGELDEVEKYRTFNMGVGFVMVVSPQEVDDLKSILKPFPAFSLYEIGQIVEGGTSSVRLI
ncbi:phosphoribosylformylglycinamidine cyclo-ligase [Legionella israelensis]|uniref:Phosphoribosylformylglycinamidine cyclo-ligase n=1 Tax=Legionella israelensis TaxID=454 RepID=A0A0W0VL04_9GAMM|nr:phosphoribosylformylglycinamidine cyclo-ligase [Legionella israelensis]KTD20784.1 phosphoribosylformylglycinamidine cyclo ligase [Legionella israelensis]QBS10984.1 phosphoribosylformylglycinamidine cyclo-ligase [Legionella israelensis]SCY06206.1 phosphoribosylformylglycinamidine cyclo-ligase [Legionella israelensis DSM 19235]STX57978.1 phosphoribosylformylglycinamidine cyclo ligase [Legionella israelensis]